MIPAGDTTRAETQATPVARNRILFVGAFVPPSATKVRGGVQFECQSLIESPLSASVEWVLLDTTMESLPPPPLTRRFFLAARRMVRFVWLALFARIDGCLIYVSCGASFWEKGAMVLVARGLGKRVVLRPVAGAMIDDYRGGWAMRRFMRRVFRSASIVACQGTRWREFVRAVAGVGDDRVPVVYNPIDLPAYAGIPLAGAKAADRALLLGWVERNKGIWDLLALVERYGTELEGLQFVLCGDGVEFAAFSRAIAEKGVQRFFDLRGWVDFDGKMQALAECEILLVLSHREGMPNALLEGMAAGRAVIATSVGAVPDVVQDGVNGFLCEPGDLADIAQRLIELRADAALRARLAGQARRRIAAQLDFRVVWPRWRDVLVPGLPSSREPDPERKTP